MDGIRDSRIAHQQRRVCRAFLALTAATSEQDWSAALIQAVLLKDAARALFDKVQDAGSRVEHARWLRAIAAPED